MTGFLRVIVAGLRIVVPLVFAWFTGTVVGASVEARAGSCSVESPWTGTSAGDTKVDSTDLVNQWWADGGNDYLRSNACDDIDVHGEAQSDDVGGGSGWDNVFGGDQNDDIYGGAENDDLSGGAGADEFFDEQAFDDDDATGGGNDDVIDMRDGDGWDSLSGGSGTDSCLSNTGDSEDATCES